MRIVFMGTPTFAVPSLQALIQAGHEICGVFTQPDKPKNRGMRLYPTPVKEVALTHSIPVFQPESLKGEGVLEQLRQRKPELIVVAAYGRILPREILELPPKGCINVHSSLLPKYRGAAPIHWAILRGETETGVTIMHMAQELDAGDIIRQQATEIAPQETAQTLYDRLAELGGTLLVQVVEEIAAGTATRTPQDHEKATFAPMLTRELSPIDWTRPSGEIEHQVRGLLPWPISSTDVISGEVLKIFAVTQTGQTTLQAPGRVLSAGQSGIDVACGDAMVLRILELQAPGSRRMSAGDYLRGHPIAGL